MFDYDAAAILPVGEGINPSKPAGHWCYEDADVLYVVRKDNGRTIVVRSCGDLGFDYAIGTTHTFQHDQTGRTLGSGTVVGVKHQLLELGELPTRKLPYYVFK